MDWLRRNWPDLTIGVALLAVVALIVVTLLSGGSLASLVRRDSTPDISLTETTPGTDTAGTEQTVEGGEAPADTTTTAGTTTADGDANGTDDGVDVFVPGVPGEQTGINAEGSDQTQTSVASGSAGTQAASGGALQDNQAGAASSGPLPEASQDGGFRVAAGAVDSREAAASLAENYRDADYAVTAEQQGDLYLLWIGPYNTRAEADRVATRLIGDGLVPDALVYTYDGPGGAENADTTTGTAATTTTDSATNPAGDTAATTEPANAAASGETPADNTATTTATGTGAGTDTAATSATEASSNQANSGATGQQFLQVGAFASDESAEPLREQLEALGFSVTRRESDAGLVRLLVGPFATAQLAQAQTRLNAEGVTDAFPVAP